MNIFPNTDSMSDPSTAARAEILARAAAGFPLLGRVTAADLIETVRLELGHAEILDGFRPYGGHFSRAEPVGPILHIVSGNTPHAALQSLLRGFLLGAPQYLKLPAGGLPEVDAFLAAVPELPPPLGITTDRERAIEYLRAAGAVIVFGSDETVAAWRKSTPSGMVFEPHPHRVSIGVVFADRDGRAAALAARDVSLYDQKGCLSAHDIYVDGDARDFARRLAREMAVHEDADPRGPISTAEAAALHDMRANYRFRAASDPRVEIHESPGSTAWTVIFEDDPWFASSCLNRVVFVKPLPDDLGAALGPASAWLRRRRNLAGGAGICREDCVAPAVAHLSFGAAAGTAVHLAPGGTGHPGPSCAVG